MTAIVACVVCARPLDSLLTSGLYAGVGVMAAVALFVVAALVRGAVAVAREDLAPSQTAAPSVPPVTAPS